MGVSPFKHWLFRVPGVTQRKLMMKLQDEQTYPLGPTPSQILDQETTVGVVGSRHSKLCKEMRAGYLKSGWYWGCFTTPLEHTPKPLPTGYKGIPFIIAWGDCLGCALRVCCNFLGYCWWLTSCTIYVDIGWLPSWFALKFSAKTGIPSVELGMTSIKQGDTSSKGPCVWRHCHP